MNKEEENYLRLSKRGFLATVGLSGKPTAVPICFVHWRGEIFTAIDKKPKSSRQLARVRNLTTTAEVAFIADYYDDDWRKLSYLLIHGKARILKRKTDQARIRRLLCAKYPQYRRMGLEGATILSIRIAKSKLWRFSGEKRPRV
jgi:PPOX class probable F420-dependent enzyme